MRSFSVLTLAGALLLGGCQALPLNRADALSPQSPATARAPQEGLSADLVYGVLAAEIAAQRGRFDIAHEEYLKAARLTGDPASAERAARFALYIERLPAARDAIDLWLELDSESLAAHSLAVVVLSRLGETDAAAGELEVVYRLASGTYHDPYHQIAAVLARIDDKSQALGLMRRLVERRGSDTQGLLSLAMLELQARQFEPAVATLERVLALRPGWSQAQILLARTRIAQGEPEAARRVLSGALEDAGDDSTVRSALARVLIELEEFEAAYEQYRLLLEQNPDNADVRYALGVVALQLDRRDAAREQFLKLYEEGQRKDDAAYHLGQLAEMDQTLDQARHWYGRALGGRTFDSNIRIAVIRSKQGELDEARELLQRLRIEHVEQAVRLYLIEGELLRNQELDDRAQVLYDEALRTYPNDTQLLYARALHAAELGRVDQLERDLRQVLAQEPDHADALNALGYTLADRTDRHQEALGYIARALELKPGNAAILDSMGWVHYRLGNLDTALRYLREAMEIMPDHEIAAHLGEVLWVKGDHEAARSVWEEALKKDPDSKFLREVMSRFQ